MADALVYHQQTVSILDPAPHVSPEALAALDERERVLGIRIPPSVREWYSLKGAAELLATYSNDDHPVPLEELGKPGWNVDAVAENRLIFMYENQAVCRWAVPLEEGDDPVVLVQGDSRRGWRMTSERFSAFVFSYIWDWHLVRFSACVLQAESGPFTIEEYLFLQEHFLEAQTTREWSFFEEPYRTDHYRFVSHDGHSRILIEDISSGRSVWHLASDSLQDLDHLVITLRDRGPSAWVVWQ